MKLALGDVKKYLPLLLLFALVPAVYLATAFYVQMEELDLLENRLEQLHQKSLSLSRQKQLSDCFSEEIKNSDHFYIDKHLETLSFLESEKKKLYAQSFQLHSGDPMKMRFEFLQQSNRLLFAESNIRRGEFFQEVQEKQQNPVELSNDDLKHLLSLVEGVSIPPYQPEEGRPQLIIQEFDLAKKPVSGESEVYLLNMQLLKRERLSTPLENK